MRQPSAGRLNMKFTGCHWTCRRTRPVRPFLWTEKYLGFYRRSFYRGGSEFRGVFSDCTRRIKTMIFTEGDMSQLIGKESGLADPEIGGVRVMMTVDPIIGFVFFYEML